MKYKILFQCVHGSHLYGLNTPDSDMDYKGVFMPDIEELLLGKSPKQISTSTGPKDAKNSAGDIDTTWYSLPEFIKLCIKGETIAIDMLHAHTYPEMVVQSSLEWKFITQHKDKFFTKNMKAFLGYAKKQAAKYGIKGSRMGALEDIYNFLYKTDPLVCNQKLLHYWHELPINEYCYFTQDTLKTGELQNFYEVLGSKYQDRMPMSQFITSIELKWESYGDRVRQAKENEGIDWKALSHALRAAYQLQEIYKHGTITYPFQGFARNYLLDVKQGKRDFLTNVQPELEYTIDLVERLAEKSEYPNEVDESFWEQWLLSLYRKELNNEYN